MATTTLDEQIRAAEEKWLELWARGPADLAWAELPPQVGDPAPDLGLRDAAGEGVSLSDLWRERPALLIFWRHYGCGCGLERAERLQAEYDEYLAAGASVAVVGQAEPERSAAYAERYGLPCRVLCDPDFRAYGAYGLKEGQVSQILFDAPEEFWRHEREFGRRFAAERRAQGRPLVDNPWLLPGEFVVDTSGTIRLAYRYQHCEDFPNPLVLKTAIQEAADR